MTSEPAHHELTPRAAPATPASRSDEILIGSGLVVLLIALFLRRPGTGA